jgi:membrane fusion protein (multidrug efflux system)
MSTPRIRSDLHATPAEEGGIKYFDVSDPKSGARMRMYDFEWLIAERMDGRRPFDEVASWARERLGIQPSASDLEEYARKLRDLGFFELGEVEGDAPARSAPTAATMMGEAPKMPVGGNGAGRASSANDADDDSAMPVLVAEGPLMGSSTPANEATAPTVAVPQISSERPPVARDAPAPAATRSAAAEPPIRSTAAPHTDQAPARSGAGSIIGIILVLLVVGGIVAYVKLMGGGGGGTTAKVATVVATPREVVRLYDGAAAVKKSDGQTLAFGEAGKVSDVVAAGTEAKAGMPLATLDSYAKIEKELADVKDRATFYEKQLAVAKTKGDEEALKTAEGKVAEKKKLLAELEARAAKVRLVAPGPGTVAQVMVQAGGDAKANEPVVRLADRRNLAEFKVPAADAAQLKPGQQVSLQAAGGGAPMAGRVAKVDGDSVTVELTDEGAAKPGDNVRLVKARVPNVVPVPPAALVKREGGEVVYVLADGVVHERKVTVVDRSGSEVLVGSGLSSGDQIVSSGAENLKDGQKAAP